MSSSAERYHGQASGPNDSTDPLTVALDSLMGRRGMVHVASDVSCAEILHELGARLPGTFRWQALENPDSPAAVWRAVLEGDLPVGEEPAPRLREMLWHRATAGIATVLGVTLDTATPDPVLSTLDELAGMEPMLQVVLVADSNVVNRPGDAARRLAMRVRVPVVFQTDLQPELDGGPTTAVEDTTVVEVVGAEPTPADAPFTAPPAPELPRRAANVGQPLEAAGQRTFDPFRGKYTEPSIDTPQLLPVLSQPHGMHAEWFRVLRLRLEDWVRARGGAPQAIAISGPEAGVGKTFVAVNLALLWANSTFERVLLIDGDLRRPQFHSLFQIPQRPGLADVLARRAEAEECTRFVTEVGLHVLPAGRAGNPRQLVNPDRVERVIESLKSAYDVIILDGPPLQGLVDARSFAAACDGTLMVVRSERTRMKSFERSIAELPADRLIGAVVNGAENGVESAYNGYHRAARR